MGVASFKGGKKKKKNTKTNKDLMDGLINMKNYIHLISTLKIFLKWKVQIRQWSFIRKVKKRKHEAEWMLLTTYISHCYAAKKKKNK